ncbi:hypothetical protein H696_04105 [Fonticula alba]|uniref:Pre-rRNA-processing protein Ipi1 N-terminal domain-containing protein n=1 Tax=Fonticula alba TaxID=691883 RepID=A0A058Z6Y7_FONAL|nr:hypothetical protein H696_04105 [Fonticula alba]KCV69698.1 hypothetical protein H696_04105 [Fonticula alba]|eukprot:XP_009496263.1 hypothetical protein H696_04105 [Fonticula alba]
MAKSQRAKDLKKKDFQKAKLRVGKKKAAPNNATDVNFKSKALVLSTQGIGQVKGDVVTEKNLTLTDLLQQLKHYSHLVRKEALVGILDLQQMYPDRVQAHLGPLLDSLFPLVLDESRGVRRNLVALLDVLFAAISAHSMSPFFERMHAFLSASLTHVNDYIRLDALLLLDVWLNRYPQAASERFDEIFPLLISMLSSDVVSRNAPTKAMAPARGSVLLTGPNRQLGQANARDAVMTTVLGLLRVAFDATGPANPQASRGVLPWHDG